MLYRNVDELREEVGRRASARLIPILIETAIRTHCRKGSPNWKDCECEYCSFKRYMTTHIGHAALPPEMRDQYRYLGSRYIGIHDPSPNELDWRYYKRCLREEMRLWARTERYKRFGIT